MAEPVAVPLNGDFTIHRATVAEVDAVISVLSEAGQWLLSRGIKQWPSAPPAKHVLWVIEHWEVYLARDGERIAGTFALSWADKLWIDRPGEAGYVHRLAIRRAYGGRGVGRWLLECAERLSAAAGKQFLRLDCAVWNHDLRAYYRRAGFIECGQATDGPYTSCLFEKPLTPVPSSLTPSSLTPSASRSP